MTKLTKKNVFEALINYAQNGELAFQNGEEKVPVSNEALFNFANHEIALLDKKAAKAKDTAAKKRAAGDELTAVVESVLTDEPQSIAEVTDQIEGEDVTRAKVQYRLNALVKAGHAVKSELTIAGEDGKKGRKVVAYSLAAENVG